MAVLILDDHGEKRELLFDLEHMLSLTTDERYRWMFERSREAMERMIRNGYLQTPQIVKRPARTLRSHRGKRVSSHGYMRLTNDVDLLIEPTRENAQIQKDKSRVNKSRGSRKKK